MLNVVSKVMIFRPFNPTAPARCKAVRQPFQADAVYLVCAKPGGLGQPGKADVHTLRWRIKSSRSRFLLTACLLLLLPIAWVDGRQDAGDKEPVDSITTYGEIAGKHLSMIIDGKILKSEFIDSGGGEALVGELRTAVGANNSGSMQGGARWMQSGTGKGISFGVGQGFRRVHNTYQQDQNRYIYVEQNSTPFRNIQYIAPDDEAFTAVYFGGFHGDFFYLLQRSNGEMYVYSIPKFERESGNKSCDGIYAISGRSLKEIWNIHGALIDDQFLSSLKTMGFTGPPGRTDEMLLKTIEAQLDSTSSNWQTFLELAKHLDSEEYAIREETSRSISSSFEKWQGQIQAGIESEELGISARAELKKILETKGDLQAKQTSSVIQSLGLLAQPDVLIRVMEDGTEEVQKRIGNRLQELTSESYGNDISAWREYLAARQVAQAPRLPDFAVARPIDETNKSPFLFATAEIAELVQFTLDDNGRLVLDRDAWSARFGGKSIKQLSDEMLEELKTRNLPTSWLKEELNQINENYGFEHVFIEKINDRIISSDDRAREKQFRYRYDTYSQTMTLNRELINEFYSIELRVNPVARNSFGGDALKRNFLDLRLTEQGEFGTRLWLCDDLEGTLRFTLLIGETGELVDFLQTADDGCRFVLIGQDSIVSGQYNTFAELNEAESDVFSQQLFPLFKRHGINLSERLGGPLFTGPTFNEVMTEN